MKADDSQDEETYANHFKCPITAKVVDPNVMIFNKRIKQATEEFLQKNPWASNFDPREKYQNLAIWE